MMNPKQIIIASLLFLLSFPCYAYGLTDCRKDFAIDKELGLIEQNWDIPLSQIRTARELTEKIKNNTPPYPQHPEKAQEMTAPAIEGPAHRIK